MLLPNRERATIPPEKIRDYLLTNKPGEGHGKPGFFLRFGFTQDHWQELEQALRDHASRYTAASMPDPYGTKYRVVGDIQTPDGRNPRIRAIWLVDFGSDVPRFITAVPA